MGFSPRAPPKFSQVPQRMKGNEQTIEPLARRVKALAESLRSPVSKDDAKEQQRREALERYAFPLQVQSGISRMRVDRKLEEIYQDLVTLGLQGKARGYFNNAENTEKLNSLVEDIRDVLMDYQVCVSNNLSFSCLIFL